MGPTTEPSVAMKLFGFLRKPDWEHKDAAVRLRAVQEGGAQDLGEVLAELAQRDPDAEVRRAALKRVDDPAVLARRMRGDPDPRVASVARERLVARLCAEDLPHEQRRAVLLDLPDPEVLADVAVRSPDAALRRAALEHISRPGLLYERCLNDPDPDTRAWLLSRIDAPEALERIAAAARRRDKALSRAARERMEQLQLASGDPAALQRRALELCERAGRLARELPEDREARLAELQDAWRSVAERVSPELQRRTGGALDMAAAAIAASRAPAAAAVLPEAVEDSGPAPGDLPATDPQPSDAPPDPRRVESPVADAADTTAEPAQADVAAAAAGEPSAPAADTRADAAEAERARQAEALSALEQALAADSVAEARSAHALLDVAKLPAGQRRRLARAEQRLRKLEEWQRWAGHDVRRRLCDEVEALHGSGLHPDALATRLKELQAEWSRLDALEGPAAPPAESGIARRFRALCHRAIRPARGYFEKRREVRAQHADQIEALLAEAAAAIDAGARGPALAAVRRQVTAALRDLDSVAPEKRGTQGRALRALLQRLDQAAQQSREEAELDKRRLLARLRRDLGQADTASALAIAREAQAEWKRLARTERGAEDALWNELRALVDPLFEKAQAREQEQRQQQADAQAAAEAVLQELEALASADEARLAHAEAHLDALQARWRALRTAEDPPASGRSGEARGGRDGARGDGRAGRSPGAAAGRNGRGADGRGARGGRDGRGDGRGDARGRRGERADPLEGRFGAAVARVQAARERLAAARERQAMDQVCVAAELLDRMSATADPEARGALNAEFVALELPADARAALQARLAGGDGAPSGDPEALVVRAELVAGLESPPEAAALRRQEQMQRLAARLEGAEQRPPNVQVRELLVALAAHPAVAPGRRAGLQERMLRAWRSLTDQAR